MTKYFDISVNSNYALSWDAPRTYFLWKSHKAVHVFRVNLFDSDWHRILTLYRGPDHLRRLIGRLLIRYRNSTCEDRSRVFLIRDKWITEYHVTQNYLSGSITVNADCTCALIHQPDHHLVCMPITPHDRWYCTRLVDFLDSPIIREEEMLTFSISSCVDKDCCDLPPDLVCGDHSNYVNRGIDAIYRWLEITARQIGRAHV